MRVIAYLLGFGMIATSAFLILYTRETVGALNSLLRNYPLRYLSAIPAVIGVLFLIAAPVTVYPWVLRFVALLSLADAILAYTNPNGIYTRTMDWYFVKVSDRAQRMVGIIGLIFGTAMLGWII